MLQFLVHPFVFNFIYTPSQLKDRLEHLITGGNYPFAKIQQKSYAITEASSAQDRPGQVWVRSDAPSQVISVRTINSWCTGE